MTRIVGVDTTGLNQAIAISQQYSERTPQVMVATAGFYIARKTTRDAKRASMGKMDSDLGADSTVVLSTRGKRKGLPLKSGRRKVALTANTPSGQSLAQRIILARMWPGTKYNTSTNQRFAIDRMALSPGEGKAAFWWKVLAAAKLMVKARHSSIAFLAASSRAVVKALEPYVDVRYRRGAVPPDPEVERAAQSSLTSKGSATVTQSGYSATMAGNLNIGLGPPSVLDERHNEAMQAWMTPALQGAIYDETMKQATYSAGKGELERRKAQFAPTGTAISPS
jgi:hypothetical protein